jgi:hypothetical protein
MLRAATLLAVVLGSGAHRAPPQAARIDGRYGLWVEDRRDTMVVHWITADSVAGYLQASGDGGDKEYTTAPGFHHATSFRRPGGKSVRLAFGAGNGARDAATVYLQAPQRRAVVTGADSVYILGDTHGEFTAATNILQQVKLIDAGLHWTGGRKHLVFDGDMMDRGPDVTRLLWFVYGLEREAEAAGGKVHVVLGNHETMVWMGDLRYTNPKELSISQAYGVAYPKLFDIRESVLGKWLITKPAVLRIDNILFAHGGVARDWLAYTPQTFDDSLAKFTGEELFYRWADTTATIKMDSAAFATRQAFLLGPNSVFWYRAYVQTDSMGAALEAVLKRFDATVHVVGHTPTAMVHQKYGGKLVVSHPRTFASEMVLLVKDGKDYRRFRIEANGNVTSLPMAQ